VFMFVCVCLRVCVRVFGKVVSLPTGSGKAVIPVRL